MGGAPLHVDRLMDGQADTMSVIVAVGNCFTNSLRAAGMYNTREAQLELRQFLHKQLVDLRSDFPFLFRIHVLDTEKVQLHKIKGNL
jgi:hypothetical protein